MLGWAHVFIIRIIHEVQEEKVQKHRKIKIKIKRHNNNNNKSSNNNNSNNNVADVKMLHQKHTISCDNLKLSEGPLVGHKS